MKQEFEMTQQEMDDIIAINNDRMPVMQIGDVVTGMDLQERINCYWDRLADKYGFKKMTVEPSSKGKLFFLAESKQIVKPKTQTEIEIDKYVGNAAQHLNSEVKEALKRIVTQLEMSDYECGGGRLNMNIAFLALKKLTD